MTLLERLNNILNKNHKWFDYDNLGEKQWRWFGGAASTGKDHNGVDYSESEYEDPSNTGLGKIGNSLGGVFEQLPELINSLVAYYGHNTLTGAEQEQNAFNAAEAQKSRDFTEYMARNKYGMETQSMQSAGVNPAMVYGGGNLVPTAANGATGQGSVGAGGNMFDMLSTMVRLPDELKKLRSDAGKADKEGDAAITNADANAKNAEANAKNAESKEREAAAAERQAAVAERQAAVQEARVAIERDLADSNISVNDQKINEMSANIAYIDEQRKYIPKYAEIAEKNANAAQKQAIAALRQGEAAIQNATTLAYKSTYETDLMFSQATLNNILQEKGEVELDWLPEQLKAKVEEMRARGLYYNKQGELVDKQGKLVQAQTAREYVGIATDVTRAACQVAGTVATGGVGGVFVKGDKPASIPTYDSTEPIGTYVGID